MQSMFERCILRQLCCLALAWFFVQLRQLPGGKRRCGKGIGSNLRVDRRTCKDRHHRDSRAMLHRLAQLCSMANGSLALNTQVSLRNSTGVTCITQSD
eukprot:3495241-Amphidinium_carterae.2